jgi:hypothetical protein
MVVGLGVIVGAAVGASVGVGVGVSLGGGCDVPTCATPICVGVTVGFEGGWRWQAISTPTPNISAHTAPKVRFIGRYYACGWVECQHEEADSLPLRMGRMDQLRGKRLDRTLQIPQIGV